MCFFGDISKNIPPYRMLRAKDVIHVKGGNQKLSSMKSLVKQVLRAAGIANRHDYKYMTTDDQINESSRSFILKLNLPDNIVYNEFTLLTS